ncbi:MAG: CRISPR-associated helicase Cas3' [Ignavibacteriaceae bacterium]
MIEETYPESFGKSRGVGDKEFIAHSENKKKQKHPLKEHLDNSSRIAESFSPREEYKYLFRTAGILHDIGKYQDGFQSYLEYGKPKTPHAAIGAYVASTLGKQFIPLQFAIKGHHAGLPNNEDRKINNQEYAENQNLVETVITRFEDSFPQVLQNLTIAKAKLPDDTLEKECLTRFLFSSLTDADWLNTESHFSPERYTARNSSTLNFEFLIKALEKTFEELPTNGVINNLRTDARNETAKHYADPLGFFSLQLPTGLGKTLTSLYWALLHARHHKLKRIIIVLPYINIIDQTALILKNVFGNDIVLEHHSGNIEEDAEYNKEENNINSKQLACENWDTPIIITTSVQFFESLFSNRPFKCRKNHNIADSIVIFDEIQTLPKQYAEPIIVMLKNITALARVSFLFCTATQPAFKSREGFNGIENIQPLIEKPEKYFSPTQRVDYELLNELEELPIESVIEKLKTEAESFLVIVNTKAVAKKIFEQISLLATYDHYYHLSTAMCPHHRKEIIQNIVRDLRDKKRIAVISTQLVEAGVDFDFPVVYRAIAPLDSIIQAAGRCNRNGFLEKGRVVLFNLENQRMPDDTYKTLAVWTKGIIKDNPTILHSSNSFEQYYETITKLFVNTDKYDITNERKAFNFKTVAESFKIIDSPTFPLFIKDYSDESKALFENISLSQFITKEEYRELQQFCVHEYQNFLTEFGSQIEMLKDTLRIWHGGYNNKLGLAPEDVETVF